MSIERLLVTGSPLSEKHVADLESLGYTVTNGSEDALISLGLEASETKRDLTEDELSQLLTDCSVYVYGGLESATDRALADASDLKLIAFLGTGWSDPGCVD